MKLNKRSLISLGIANDERGKDSCGIFIDGRYEKFANKEDKLFINAFSKSKVLKETKECEIAFVHCRKASVGTIDEEHAQPVVIEENGKVQFCLLHNGTIYNYEELAKKYIPQIDIKGWTDSQVIAHIFYHNGYNVLTEYEGTGVFVIKDYRNEALYMFKGSSLDGWYSSAKVKEERPLFVAQNGHSIIFSSIFNTLYGLYYKHKIKSLPPNKLWKVKDNKVLFVREYDRSNCHQTKKVASYSSSLTSYDYNEISPATKSVSTYKSKEVSLLPTTGTYVDSDKQLLNGPYIISDFGYINSSESTYAGKYWFYEGILLRGELVYENLINFYKQTNDKKLTKSLARLLGFNPYNLGSTWVYLGNDFEIANMEGEYQFPFVHKTYTFNKGRCINTANSSYSKPCPRPDSLCIDDILMVIEYVKSL